MILEDGAVELLNVLFPHLAGVHVERVVASGRLVRLEAATRAPEAVCPLCGHPSSRVHSRYERWLADRGVSGREVSIQLRVRRFFCTEPSCARRIFAEQVPGLTERYRRCSPGLRAMLTAVGLALGGRAGALMTRHLNAARSPKTLLRLLRALPVPVPGALRVVGVDEFAVRRGHSYGTVLVDMDTRRPVDMLGDRTSTTLAAWLEKHPGVEVVCRDRAGPYAEGVSSGAPQARQVADRWHLLHNLVEVVERILKRNRAALVEATPEIEACDAEIPPAPVEGALAARTRQRHHDVHALAERGVNLTNICRALKLDPKTVNRYLRAGSPEELIAPAAQRATSLERFKVYLAGRFADGCTNAARLWAELHAQGYRGHRRTVRRYLNRLANGAVERKRAEEFTAREVRQWILRRPDRLDPDDRDRLQSICARSPIIAATTELAQAFALLLRERRGQQLGAWVQAVEAAEIPELRAFAVGLRKDWDAVVAGLTLPWSSGAVEGHGVAHTSHSPGGGMDERRGSERRVLWSRRQPNSPDVVRSAELDAFTRAGVRIRPDRWTLSAGFGGRFRRNAQRCRRVHDRPADGDQPVSAWSRCHLGRTVATIELGIGELGHGDGRCHRFMSGFVLYHVSVLWTRRARLLLMGEADASFGALIDQINVSTGAGRGPALSRH